MIERSGLAFPLGLGIIALIMLTLNLLGIKLGFINIIMVISVIAIASLIWSLIKRYPIILFSRSAWSVKQLSLLEALLLGITGLIVLYVYFAALIKPVLEFDALWRHSLIARTIFLDKTFLTPFTQEIMQGLPPFSSFAQGWVFFCMNGWNEMLGKIIFPTLYLALLLISYAVLKKYFSRLRALTFTFLVASLPLMVFHASTAYADLPQTVYYSVGSIYLLTFILSEFRAKSDLIISALFLGLGIIVKQHGIYLAGLNGLILIAALWSNRQLTNKEKSTYVMAFSGIIILLGLPWLTFNPSITQQLTNNLSSPFTQSAITPKESLPPLAERFSQALNIFFQKMFVFGNWHLAWALLVICLIFFSRIVFLTPLIYWLALIALNLIYLFAALTLTGAYKFLLDGTLLNRMMMYQLPLVVLFSAFSLPKDKAVEKNKKKK